MSTKIQHKKIPILYCYEDLYIEYCQLLTDVAYASITIYVTISCYIVTRLIIKSALKYLDSA